MVTEDVSGGPYERVSRRFIPFLLVCYGLHVIAGIATLGSVILLVGIPASPSVAKESDRRLGPVVLRSEGGKVKADSCSPWGPVAVRLERGSGRRGILSFPPELGVRPEAAPDR